MAADNVHVLVVDKDEQFAAYMVTLLHSLGFGAAAAPSAHGAIESAERRRPTVLLSNVDVDDPLPDLRLADIIRARWDTPVILMCTRIDREAAAAIVAARPSGVLYKPFHCGQLKITLRLALDERVPLPHEDPAVSL